MPQERERCSHIQVGEPSHKRGREMQPHFSRGAHVEREREGENHVLRLGLNRQTPSLHSLQLIVSYRKEKKGLLQNVTNIHLWHFNQGRQHCTALSRHKESPQYQDLQNETEEVAHTMQCCIPTLIENQTQLSWSIHLTRAHWVCNITWNTILTTLQDILQN